MMKFTIDNSIAAGIERIINEHAPDTPHQTTCKDKKHYEISGLSEGIQKAVMADIKKFIEARGLIFNEIT